MNKTNTAAIEAARARLTLTERHQQAAMNESEFAKLAHDFFETFPLREAVEFVQSATTKELSDYLEEYELQDPEYVPDEIMKITLRGHRMVELLSHSHELLLKIKKEITNGNNPLPAGPAARA